MMSRRSSPSFGLSPGGCFQFSCPRKQAFRRPNASNTWSVSNYLVSSVAIGTDDVRKSESRHVLRGDPDAANPPPCRILDAPCTCAIQP